MKTLIPLSLLLLLPLGCDDKQKGADDVPIPFGYRANTLGAIESFAPLGPDRQLHIVGQFIDPKTAPAIPFEKKDSCTYYDLNAWTNAKVTLRNVGDIDYAIGADKHVLTADESGYQIVDYDPVPVGTTISFSQKAAGKALGTFEGAIETVAPMTLKPGIWQDIDSGTTKVSRQTSAAFEWQARPGRALLQIIPNNDVGTYPQQIQCEVDASTGRLEVPAQLLGQLVAGSTFGMFSTIQTETITTSSGDEIELQAFARPELDGKPLSHFLLELE